MLKYKCYWNVHKFPFELDIIFNLALQQPVSDNFYTENLHFRVGF
jgi:hypothetical protein